MGFQSLTIYVVLAWLPAVLTSRGAEESYAGWMLSLSQATGIVGSLIIPTVADRWSHQRAFVWGLTIFEVVALAGLFAAVDSLSIVCIVLLGFVLGGSFGLSLLFIVLRASNTQSATELSGMAQSIGYLVAASGPTIFGGLYDWTAGWDWPFGFLFAVAAIKLLVGLKAGADAVVEPPESIQ
jgi:CP family cyanate transporter-like MFS transporter